MVGRTFLFLTLMAACAFLLVMAADIESDSVLSHERQLLVITEPGNRRRVRRKAGGDAAPPLGEGDLALFRGGLTRSELTKLHDGYVDRMLAKYAEAEGFPPPLAGYLKKNRDVGEVFVTAIDPFYDDICAAARVFDDLRLADENRLEKYVHLATALAVVHDTPDAVLTSRYHSLWGVTREQFSDPPKPREVWDYYTDASSGSRFRFAIDKLPWPILVHLADNDARGEDREWSLSKYNAHSTEIVKLYYGVGCDNSKERGGTPQLGAKPYALPNLLRYGGVCGDRAHFASRVAKCVGVPAMKVVGGGRSEGTGHTWMGFLAARNGWTILDFTGNPCDDFYTGDVFDPQTHTLLLDRFLAMDYDGALRSYPRYIRSRMLVRMARGVRPQRPREAVALLREALRTNPLGMWSWPLLMDFIKDGTVPRDEALPWADRMLKALKDHPDMTFNCLGTFLDCIPEGDAPGRESLLDRAEGLYGERPDLLNRLRLEYRQLAAAAPERPSGD